MPLITEANQHKRNNNQMTETNKFENLFDNNTSSENRIFTFAFDRGRKIANLTPPNYQNDKT